MVKSCDSSSSSDIILQNFTLIWYKMTLSFLIGRKWYSFAAGTFGDLQIGLKLEEQMVSYLLQRPYDK